MALCFANGGVYVKLGQHVGQLDHLLPEEYVLTMRKHLLDRCPASPYDDVRRVVELHDKYARYVQACFGNASLFHKALKEAFESFVNKPVAGSTSKHDSRVTMSTCGAPATSTATGAE